MIRITQTGTVPTPNGDMYKFTVEVDAENTIEVNIQAASAPHEESEEEPGFHDSETDDAEDTLEEDETPLDEIPPARTKAPVRAAQPPSKAAQAKVKGLLGNRKSA